MYKVFLRRTSGNTARFGAAALVAVSMLALPLPVISSASASATTVSADADSPQSVTFDCTGAQQQFDVPPGVTTLHVVLTGASGRNNGNGDNPGPGAVVSGDLEVTPGEFLDVQVGCSNGYGYSYGGASGAGDFTGASGGNGGGSTGIGEDGRSARDGGPEPVAVAGGGGGSGGTSGVLASLTGGAGGGPGALGGDGKGSGGGLGGFGYPATGPDGADGVAATSGSDSGGGGGGGGGWFETSVYLNGGGAAGAPGTTASGGGGGNGGRSYFVGITDPNEPDVQIAPTLGNGQLILSYTGPTGSAPVTVTCSGTVVPYVVPANVSELKVVASGAQGGTGGGATADQSSSSPGGLGSVDVVGVSVVPGQTVDVTAGCAGGNGTAGGSSDVPGGAGGYGVVPGAGGGSGSGFGGLTGGGGGAGGGGSSGITTSVPATSTDSVLVLAGGGGGSGGDGTGYSSSGGTGGAGGPAADVGASGSSGNGISTTCDGTAGSPGTPSDILDGATGGGSAGTATESGGGGGGGGGFASGLGGGPGGIGQCGGGGGAGAGSFLSTGVTPGDASGESGLGTGNGLVDITPVFTIPAAPTNTVVTVPIGAVYDGTPKTATAQTFDVQGNLIATPAVTYDSGGAPVDAGTYTASASYPGDAAHLPSSDSEQFTIAKAPTTIAVTANSETYSGSPDVATAVLTGPGGLDEEQIVDYAGVNGTTYESTTAPTQPGDYTASAYFVGNSNYLPADPDPTVAEFSITEGAPVFTSAPTATFTVGQPGAATVTTAGSPSTTISDGGAPLPPGLSLVDQGNGTAVLSGTPSPGSSLGGTSGTYTFPLVADDGIAPVATETFTVVIDPPAPPASETPPQISGAPVVGHELAATTGDWSSVDALTYTYQWVDCALPTGLDCAPIAGAVSSTYTPVPGDVGFSIEVSVTAHDQDGQSTSASSGPYPPVEPDAAAAVRATSGTPQTVTVGRPFAHPLVATVTDVADSPFAGAPVTFAVATGDATFPGGTATATVPSGADGTAIAPALTAGDTPGAVTVTASVPGVVTTADFNLSVEPTAWARPASSGRPTAKPGGPSGFYLGVHGEGWRLDVTHPGSTRVDYSGTITIDQGSFTNVRMVRLEGGDTFTVSGGTITFTFHNFGRIDGLTFTTPTGATTLTSTLAVGGVPAGAQDIHLGRTGVSPQSGSPLTIDRVPVEAPRVAMAR